MIIIPAHKVDPSLARALSVFSTFSPEELQTFLRSREWMDPGTFLRRTYGGCISLFRTETRREARLHEIAVVRTRIAREFGILPVEYYHFYGHYVKSTHSYLHRYAKFSCCRSGRACIRPDHLILHRATLAYLEFLPQPPPSDPEEWTLSPTDRRPNGA